MFATHVEHFHSSSRTRNESRNFWWHFLFRCGHEICRSTKFNKWFEIMPLSVKFRMMKSRCGRDFSQQKQIRLAGEELGEELKLFRRMLLSLPFVSQLVRQRKHCRSRGSLQSWKIDKIFTELCVKYCELPSRQTQITDSQMRYLYVHVDAK